MLREIARACEDASWDDEIRVVVVTGTGRAFCVGADLRSWDEDSSETRASTGSGSARSRTCTTACARSASRRSRGSTASRSAAATSCRWHATLPSWSTPRSSATSASSTARSPRAARRSGFSSWSEIAARARSSSSATRFPAAQAAEWGLVNRAVPEAELDGVVDEWVEKLAARLPRDDALREAAAQRLARPRLAPDGGPRTRLARDVDARK